MWWVLEMWSNTCINSPNFLLRFLLKYVFVWEAVSKTCTCVWSHFQTPQTFVKNLGCTYFFNFRSLCLEMCWKTSESVWYITSNTGKTQTQQAFVLFDNVIKLLFEVWRSFSNKFSSIYVETGDAKLGHVWLHFQTCHTCNFLLSWLYE